MEAPLEHLSFDHRKTPDLIDATGNYTYDHFSGLDYLSYPHSPNAIGSMGLSTYVGSPRLGSMPMAEYGTYTSGGSYVATSSPSRPYTPSSGIYPAALSNLSAGELSSDSMQSGRRSRSGSGRGQSPSPSVPRAHRFNPIAVPPSRIRERVTKKKSKSSDSDDDDDFQPATPPANETGPSRRREEIRRQRIESEQRRRDELREGYRRLKDSLPVSNQKSSKVSLLDRATTHIKYLEMTQSQLSMRLQSAENETQRLRQVNEALMLGTAEQRQAVAAAAVAAVSQQHSSVF
jgi:hypothetical protein